MTELLFNFNYLAIILVIFGEVGLMLFFLPGDTLLFVSGILASEGKLSYPLLVATIFISSSISGHIGYYLGSKVDKNLLTNNKFYKINTTRLEKTERLFHRYGSLLVVFSRFIPVARNLISQVCGMVSYSKKKFFIYNLIASLLWPTVIVTLGFKFGKTFPEIITQLKVFIGFVLVILTLYLSVRFVKKVRVWKKSE